MHLRRRYVACVYIIVNSLCVCALCVLYSYPCSDHTLMSPYHAAGLPPRNGPLSSSIGSVATLTTVADEQVDPEECGRVAGWVANFDKLLQDPLGVQCLLVSAYDDVE